MIVKGIELSQESVETLKKVDKLFEKMVLYIASGQNQEFLIDIEHCALLNDIVNQGLYIVENIIKTDTYEI